MDGSAQTRGCPDTAEINTRRGGGEKAADFPFHRQLEERRIGFRELDHDGLVHISVAISSSKNNLYRSGFRRLERARTEFAARAGATGRDMFNGPGGSTAILDRVTVTQLRARRNYAEVPGFNSQATIGSRCW